MLRNLRAIDWVIITLLAILTLYSCAAIAGVQGNPQMPSHAWEKQLAFALLGFVMLFLVATVDYRSFRRWQWWLYGVTTFLLVAVFAFHPVNHAHSWIPLKVFSLQPSEFAKLSLVVAMSGFMAKMDEQELPGNGIQSAGILLLVVLVPLILTLKEPALGQALVMLAMGATMYSLFARRSVYLLICAFVLVVLVLIVVLPTLFPSEAAAFVENVLIPHHILHGFQADRILTWLDPGYELNSAGYNVHQAQLAVGSGQVFGEGALNGLLSTHGGVPNQWTDYIFSSIAEQMGFLGSTVLVFCFLMLIYRLVRIARSAQDTFGTYLVIGFIGMFSFQVFENIGMNMYMSPSTGITLPFISYGGSSLLANFIGIGISMSVSARFEPLRFKR